MDLTSFGIGGVAAITVVCYLLGLIAKASNLNNKWIPIICGFSGLILGIIAMTIMPDFPAADYITAAAVGVVSGLAATGFDQVLKQLKGKDE